MASESQSLREHGPCSLECFHVHTYLPVNGLLELTSQLSDIARLAPPAPADIRVLVWSMPVESPAFQQRVGHVQLWFSCTVKSYQWSIANQLDDMHQANM